MTFLVLSTRWTTTWRHSVGDDEYTRMSVTIMFTYDAKHEWYENTDPEDMASVDEENIIADPGVMADLVGEALEDGRCTIVVSPILE